MRLIHGDCLDVLRTLADNSVDSVVTDPPYGLSFMGKKWDYDVPAVEVWAQCLRVLKPGGHLLAFAGTRTQHRMAVRIEDAGFEIRDMIAWVYGSGFPKSLDVGKAIDREAGAVREVVGSYMGASNIGKGSSNSYITDRPGTATIVTITAPATDAARQWQGWGTALKPALEPITVARKPLAGTVASNVTTWGTGGINVDGCRVGTSDGYTENTVTQRINTAQTSYEPRRERRTFEPSNLGRWPANLIHDGSDEVVRLFPETGASTSAPRNNGAHKGNSKGAELPHITHGHDDNGGSAARFFYCPKTSKADREQGCAHLEARSAGEVTDRDEGSAGIDSPRAGAGRRREETRNHHPTVKPTDLMRYLCRLVTPPGGTVLDPFMGSGSTGKGAALEGFDFIGIEREAEYLTIARARIGHVEPLDDEPTDAPPRVGQMTLF